LATASRLGEERSLRSGLHPVMASLSPPAATKDERPALRDARGSVFVSHADGGSICERCTVARSAMRRMRGLLGRKSLAPGEGLLILRAPSIHTFFMRVPIDVIFLSRGGEVLKVCHQVTPWRVRACRSAYAVVELAAGEAGRRAVAPGDSLALRNTT
jgi:uncharacterized membrane protein (UPF0127 family)